MRTVRAIAALQSEASLHERSREPYPLVLATSHTLARLEKLEVFLQARVRLAGFAPQAHDAARAVLAWGYKPSAAKAVMLAKKLGLPVLRLEDGFLRSVGMGRTDPPLSIVVDDVGMYYDAGHPSRLEHLIAAQKSAEEQARARQVLLAWRQARVSKYNHARENPACAIDAWSGDQPDTPYVLVIDQVAGDASIRYGSADAASFARMLQAALDENPSSTVVVKLHPAAMQSGRQGHFNAAELARQPRIRVLSQDAHPVGLIERAQAVYTVTSQMGFEALLWGKKVRTFGMPFYAGWGLTADDLPAPKRRHAIALENLVYAALIEYPRYLDPETGDPCQVERIIDWMGLQRRMRERFPAEVFALNFSFYKRPIVRDFFQGSRVHFIRSPAKAPGGATVAVWGCPSFSKRDDLRIVSLEDGFLRSVGLGADLTRPLSWVMDTLGIYYDPRSPSALEALLQSDCFAPPLLERAQALCEHIVAHDLSKYNLAGQGPQLSPGVRFLSEARLQKRTLILVPGQVESDAALAFGAPGIRRNMELLRAVRLANPDALVVYKPHPDVAAGLRSAGQDEERANTWCDLVVSDAPIGQLLHMVDEVHTLTSLTGFEALLRGKTVVCYGQPFYAGWGLTRDMAPIARRSRRLSMPQLAAATLCLYPTYVSRVTRRYTTPERALQELLSWRAAAADLPWWRRILRVVLRLKKR